MITITEKQSQKVSGETSLFISFNYKPEYVEIVKSCTGSYYYTKDKTWEVPIIYLEKLIDELYKYDDIELNLIKEKEKKEEVKPELHLEEYKLQPLDYQIEDIEYGLTHDKWLLLSQPGTGKTMITLHIAEELYRQGKIEHCLVVCGLNALKANWAKEIQKHTNLSYRILGEKISKNGIKSQMTAEQRVQQLKNKIDEFFIIIGVGSLRNEKLVKELNQGINKIDMVLMDEAHKCKDPSSQQGAGLLKLKNAKYKISMTGTLILNNPIDSYLSLKWIGVEKSSLGTFRHTYCNYNGNIPNGTYKNLDLLKSEIDNHSVRRMKDLLNLPPKTIIPNYVEMGEAQDKFYNEVKKGIKDEVDKIELNTSNLLALTTRLRQATACPSFLTTENVPSEKVNTACELVEEIIDNDKKVVIFSTFVETVHNLEKLLEKYNPLICTGEMSDDEINQNITKFQNDDNYKLLIGTWQRVGTGLDLYAATEAIFIDTPWTQALFDQCCDRLHRIGQNKPITIYKMITADTIDEHCDEILERKRTLSDYMIDDTVTDDGLEILRKYIEDL